MKRQGGRKPTDIDYGRGEHVIDGEQLGLMDEAELTRRLLKTFSSKSYTPPRLPAVAMELMGLSQKPDVEFSAVEALLEQDAMLAGEVLSVGRSAYYSRTQPARSLRDALVRVGLNKLRQIVMQAAMNMRVFRSTAYARRMELLREHCQTTAHLCRIVARYTPMEEDQAFLCGLMHDIGFAGILLVLGDVKRGAKAPELDVLWPALNNAHAEAGARMVQLWGLPQEVSMVVGAHHQVSISGYNHPMAATVCLAEHLAIKLGKGFLQAAPDDASEADSIEMTIAQQVDRTDRLTLERAQAALQIPPSTLKLIEEDSRKWIAEAEVEPQAVR